MMGKYILMLLFFAATVTSHAQQKAEPQMKWWNPATSTTPVLEGQLWPAEVKSFYDRLPARAEQMVRPEVWGLSHNAAGLKIRFNTNAQTVQVRYVTTGKSYAMDHFPATGRSGLDLYGLNLDGSWAWARGAHKFGDTITCNFVHLNLDAEKFKDGREYCLYLPLYNGVKWMEIGVPETNSFQQLPPRNQKPIIAYGTSITQGGVASRPGMAWTNILDRALNTPVVNLGFSGNGRLEKELISMISETDASVYVLDCLGNLSAGTDSLSKDVTARIVWAVTTLRSKHPNTPIVLTDDARFLENRMDTYTVKGVLALNNASAKAYAELTAKGVKQLYVLSNKSIGLGMDGTVDGTHPTDLGMLRYATAYEKLLRTILKK